MASSSDLNGEGVSAETGNIEPVDDSCGLKVKRLVALAEG